MGDIQKRRVHQGGPPKIFLGSLYISPTAQNAEKAQQLLETIAAFQAKGEVLISGDFNA